MLRDLYDRGSVASFVDFIGKDTAAAGYGDILRGFASRPTSSWEFYEEAAAMEVPVYKVGALHYPHNPRMRIIRD